MRLIVVNNAIQSYLDHNFKNSAFDSPIFFFLLSWRCFVFQSARLLQLWPRPTLLWISQGLAMADRSQAVIIMALETQERHSGWYVIRPPTSKRQCTESLKSVQQNTPKIRHQIVRFPSTSHQRASPFTNRPNLVKKNLDKCGQLLRVFHTDLQLAVILLYVPDWRMFGLTCSSCAGGLWPSLSRFANHEKVERIKN